MYYSYLLIIWICKWIKANSPAQHSNLATLWFTYFWPITIGIQQLIPLYFYMYCLKMSKDGNTITIQKLMLKNLNMIFWLISIINYILTNHKTAIQLPVKHIKWGSINKINLFCFKIIMNNIISFYLNLHNVRLIYYWVLNNTCTIL